MTFPVVMGVGSFAVCLTTSHHPVVYSHKTGNHSTIDMIRSIINTFNNAPAIYIAESDNSEVSNFPFLLVFNYFYSLSDQFYSSFC